MENSTKAKTFTEEAKTIENSINYMARFIQKRSSVDFEDARQEMLIAAWKAFEAYDPTKARFSTLAVFSMRNRAKTIIDRGFKSEDATAAFRVVDITPLDEEGRTASDSMDLLKDTKRLSPEDQLIQAEESLNIDGNQRLDEVERCLVFLAEDEVENGTSAQRANQHALTIFRKMRYELYKREDGKTVPKTLSIVSREIGLIIQRVSSIFTNHVKVLGNDGYRQGILIRVKTKEEVMAKAKVAEEAPAKTKKKTAAVEEPAKKGRAATSGGQKDKVAWLTKMFVEKGKSRSEAIAALQEKYPEMSVNYARTIVYTTMKEAGWVVTDKPAKPAKKVEKKTAPAKAAAPKTKKAAAVEEDDEEEDAPAPKKAPKAAAAPAKKTPKKAAVVEEDEDDDEDTDDDDFDL